MGISKTSKSSIDLVGFSLERTTSRVQGSAGPKRTSGTPGVVKRWHQKCGGAELLGDSGREGLLGDPPGTAESVLVHDASAQGN